MWTDGKGGVLASVHEYGRGRVVLTTVDYLMPRQQANLVGTTVKMVHPAEARADVSPYETGGFAGGFFRHGDGVQWCRKKTTPDGSPRPGPDAPLAHRRPGYPLPGCVPAEPDSVSPGRVIIPLSFTRFQTPFGHRRHALKNPLPLPENARRARFSRMNR